MRDTLQPFKVNGYKLVAMKRDWNDMPIVLCDRGEVFKDRQRYVTWAYNEDNGACFWGHYIEGGIEAAEADLNERTTAFSVVNS